MVLDNLFSSWHLVSTPGKAKDPDFLFLLNFFISGVAADAAHESTCHRRRWISSGARRRRRRRRRQLPVITAPFCGFVVGRSSLAT